MTSLLISIQTKPVGSVRSSRDDLADQLYRQWKEAIVRGQYRAGDDFPTVQYWVQTLGLAAKTVHTATKQLITEGLLIVEERSQGTKVCEPPRAALMDMGEVYLSPVMIELLRLGLSKSESSAVVERVLASIYVPRQGDRRSSVRTAPLLGKENRQGEDRRKAPRASAKTGGRKPQET